MSKERRNLRKETTEEGRRIWRAVDAAAARAPEWMKERVARALEERAKSDAGDEAAIQSKSSA